VRRWIKRIAIGLGGLLGLVVAAVLAAWGFANTQAGRDFIAEQAAAALGAPDAPATVSGLSGPLPQRIGLDTLKLRDPQGTWLTVENAELAWNPLALVTGQVAVTRLTAERVAVARAPEGGEAPAEPAAQPGSLGLPDLPVAIRVDTLRAERIELGAPLLGQAATFRLAGRVAAPSAGAMTSALTVTRLDGPAAAVEATAAFAPDARTLDLDLAVDGTAAGLFATAAGLAPDADVNLRLTGDGPLAAWQGQFRAALGPTARAGLELGVADGARLHVKGQVTPGDLAPAPVPELLGGPAELDLTLARGDGWRRVEIAESRIATPNARLDLAGSYDTDTGTLDARADLAVTDPAALNRLAGPAAVRDAKLRVRAEGPLLAPTLDTTLTAAQVRAPQVTLADATVSTRATPEDGFDRAKLALDVKAKALRSSLPQLAGLSGHPLEAAAAARLDTAAQTLSGVRLDAGLGSATLRLREGRADLSKTTGEARYTLELADLAALDPVLNMGLSGNGTLDGRLDVAANADPILDATLAGDLREVAWAKVGVLDALLGGPVRLDTRARLAADGGLRLTDTAIQSPAAKVTGSLAFPGDFATIDGDLTGRLADLGALGGAFDLPMSGAADVAATLAGPTGDPTLEAEVSATDTALAGTDLGRVTIDTRLANLASGLNGPLAVTTGTSPAGPAEVAAEIALGDGAFRLRDGTANIPGLAARGVTLDLPLDGGAMTGRADLASDDLGAVAPLADSGVAGRLDGILRLAPGQSGQGLTADLALHSLAAGGAQVARADVTAQLEDVLAAPAGKVTLELADAQSGGLKLASAQLGISGGLADADLALRAQGDVYGPLELAADARLTQDGATRRLRLTRLDATVQDRELALARPAVLEQGPDGMRVRDFTLRANGGTAALSLAQTAERIDATLTLDALPAALANLALAEPKLTGALNGELTLEGPLDAPRADWTFTADKLAATETALPPLTARVAGELAEGRLTTEARVTGLSDTPLRLEAALPLRASLDPFAIAPESDAPLSGSLQWQGELAPIVPLIPVTGHRLGGSIAVDMDLAGTLAAPEPSGTITLTDAVYENLSAGTLLTEIAAEIGARGRKLTIRSFQASDGDEGTVTLDGTVDLADPSGAAIDLRARTKEAVLIRRDELHARANSDIAVTGTAADMSVEGTVTVTRAEVRVPESMPAEVATLDVTEVGGDTGRAPGEDRIVKGGTGEADVPAETSRVGLNVRVKIPNRMFVRGRGLDTEWQGDLTVTGTAAQPVVNGQITAVRGRIDALSKTFSLASGEVAFDGGESIDPQVGVEAVHQGEDIIVTVRVSGPAAKPEIDISSQPELPQDEILSRMLFGKQVTDLSGAQAAQLAAAVAELSGATGSGPGFMEKIRRGLGVDVLQFGGESGTSVRAGQYLSEDVFLGVEQGLDTESSRVTLEVGITDNIAVESNVGATGNSDVGLQFKWDY